MSLTHATRDFVRSSARSAQPTTQPRRAPKTGKPTTIIASLSVEKKRDRTPVENLWIAIFEKLEIDAVAGQIHSGDFDFDEKCKLDFVAWALGWPTNTLPQIFFSAAEARAKQRRKGMALV